MNGYEALRESAAWIDLSARGKICVNGDDRARLLYAITTNHIQQLTSKREGPAVSRSCSCLG
jgi:glycine cleavage system aminomethyltransferase T